MGYETADAYNGMDVDEVNTLLETLYLHRVEARQKGGADTSSLNIYLDLKNPTPQQWNTITKEAGKIKYNMNLNGYRKYSKG